MPLLKRSSNIPTSETNPLPTPPKDESPPPAYTSHAPDNASADPPDITAAFSNLNLNFAEQPTPDQCLAHLKLLETFHQLREDVATRDGLFGIRDSFLPTCKDEKERAQRLMQIREKRWAVYVTKAAQRFEKWWTSCVQPNASPLNLNRMQDASMYNFTGGRKDYTQSHADRLPPIDVLMVWHAYHLNPRDYLEDCFRFGKMDTWKAGFPWADVNSCIDNSTFEYLATEPAQDLWTKATGFAWNSLNDSQDASVSCPMCQRPVKVPWTGWTDEGQWQISWRDTLQGEMTATGFADKAMRAQCNRCQTPFTGETLKLAKFRTDFEALKNSAIPMPGTLLNVDGLPEQIRDVTPHLPSFPNRLLLKDIALQGRIKDATNPAFTAHSMTSVRQAIESSLVSGDGVRIANGSRTKRLTKEERIAIRRMMSHYWGNSSPFALDLVGAVIRQASFIEKMHAIDWIHSPAAVSTMKRLITKYTRYMTIIAQHPSKVAVPTLDVDLAWHTHQLSPQSYYTYTVRRTRKFTDHDDKIDETALSDSFEWTSKTYQKMYKELYSECTCWYCEAIRESHSSNPLSRAFKSSSSSSSTIDDQLANLHSASDHTTGPHISAHNAIKADTLTGRTKREQALQRKLERDYQRACHRARKQGRDPPPNRDEYMHNYAYMGMYPIYMPYYAPYMGDPCVTPGVYANNPSCASFVPGASGNCCAGACGGGVAAGSCGGGGSAGGCAGGAVGGGGFGGCGGGGGGGFGGCGGGGGGGCGGGGGGC